MRFTVLDLEREAIDFSVDLPAGSVDFDEDTTQIGPMHSEGRAEALHEHRSATDIVIDIRLRAHFQGEFEVPCARCVTPVRHHLEGDFDLIFRPAGVDAENAEGSISTQETEIGYYEGGSLQLEDVLREQVLLALPARTLCHPDCKGLCPVCGQNRNEVPCDCAERKMDPKWSQLAQLSKKDA